MVSVTPNFTAALNGASSVAEGLVHQKNVQFSQGLAKKHLELYEEKQALEEQLAQQAMDARRAEIERLSGRDAGVDEIAKAWSEDFKPKPQNQTSGDDFFGARGDLPPSSNDADNPDEYLQQQREHALMIAKGLSPRARAEFLRTAIPGLEEDEHHERNASMTRHALDEWKKAERRGILDDDGQVVGQHTIEGLQAQKLDPLSALDSLHVLQRSEEKRFSDEANYQFGNVWAQEQIQQAAVGGVDVKPLHDVMSKWRAGNKEFRDAQGNMDPRRFQAAILEARYGLKLDKVKIGSLEIPKNTPTDSWQFRQVADREAEKAAQSFVARDPELKMLATEAAKDEEKRPAFKKAYDEKFQAAKYKELSTYSALMGAEPPPPPPAKKVDVDALVKAAGGDVSKLDDPEFFKRLMGPAAAPSRKRGPPAGSPGRGALMRRAVPPVDTIDETTFFHGEDR